MAAKTLTLDAHAWAQECTRRARTAGVGFVWDATAKGPCTDGRIVRVPPLPVDASADDFTVLRGAVIHETGHLLRPQCFDIQRRENLDMESPLGALFNIVEDMAQERASAMRWRGDRKSLADAHAVIAERQIAKAATAPRGAPINPDAVKLMAAMATGLQSAADWSPDMATGARRYAAGMDRAAPGVLALFDELCGEGWPARIAALDTVADSWQLARELFARLFPDKSEESQKQPQDGSGKPKPGKRGKPGKGGEESAPGSIPWDLITHSDHRELDDAPHPSRVDWTGKTGEDAPVWHTEESTKRPPITPRGEAAAESMPFPAALVGEVRRLLQARARVRWDHEKLDGRLDVRNAARILMPQVGDGTFNRSIFRQRGETTALDVAMTILVDCSGSMSGNKIHAATAAAMALNDLCATALRIPSEVLGFTTTYTEGPLTLEFKTFAERRVNRAVVGARMAWVETGGVMAGNADGDSLMLAAGRLRTRRESRKVLIVLSDGSPTDHAPGGDAFSNLRHAVRGVRASGIEVYGIGIEDDNVRRFYSPDAPVIQRADEVPQALVAVLRDVLQRKGPPA